MSITKVRAAEPSGTGGVLGTMSDICDAIVTPMGSYFTSVEKSYTAGTKCSLDCSVSSTVVMKIGRTIADDNDQLVSMLLSSGEAINTPSPITVYMKLPTAYVCSNAVLIAACGGTDTYGSSITTPDTGAFVVVTKNNRNVTTIIMSMDNYQQYHDNGHSAYTGVRCIALDDDIYSTNVRATLTFSQRESNQLQLVPFISCPASGALSYTPNVYYITSRNFPVADNASDWFTINVAGYAYLTNGYWAIKDDPIP